MAIKVLLVGAAGLLGSYLHRTLDAAGHDVTATWRTNPPDGDQSRWHQLDVLDRTAVRATLSHVRPNIVVQASGLTNVDECERNPEASKRLNLESAQTLASEAHRVDARMVFYSTDYIFDGTQGAYQEEDHAHPINVYGRHKWEGEEFLRSRFPDSLILRVSVVYGLHPRRQDFVSWLLSKMSKGETIPVVTDQVNSPTYAGFAASVTEQLLRKGLSGTFHVVGKGAVARFDFARLVASEFGFPASRIQPIDRSSFRQDAPRPHDTSLRVDKIESALGLNVPDHVTMLQQLRSEQPGRARSLPGREWAG